MIQVNKVKINKKNIKILLFLEKTFLKCTLMICNTSLITNCSIKFYEVYKPTYYNAHSTLYLLLLIYS